MNRIIQGLTVLSVLVMSSCGQKEPVDLFVYNASIYTVDSSFSITEAMVINDGKIVATGTRADLEKKYEAEEILDAQGKFIYPGFIDAHAHFLGYGMGLLTADLVGTNSWESILEKLKTFAAEHPEGWIIGRGWDQNDWEEKKFPSNDSLNKLFPDRPVILERVDGHAAVVNQKALDIAGIKPGDKIEGGEIETRMPRPVDSFLPKLTGILVDNAINLVGKHIPAPDKEQLRQALLDAQKNCFAVGLTTIDDCGLNASDVTAIRALQDAGDLKMRLYVMLSDAKENYEFLDKSGIIKTDKLHVRSFKVYGDGALGSRGACLLQPYSDKPGYSGFLLSNAAHFDSVANQLYQKGFQMCTHAIGDSGNRTMLNVYAKYLKGKNDLRWRIEHAQVVNKSDFSLFGAHSIIPSVQPTHATSDMYWAGDRLGAERVKGAYAYQQLLKENGWLPLGTDFPVEDISTLKTFYAAVIRKDAKGWPEGGYQMENALTRQQAIRGMTIWAAKSNFEELEKGSLEKGKLADFVILDQDLMKAPEQALLNIQVLQTFLAGTSVFKK